ncbi:hypothetical protein G8764_07885 [Pseudomaricurvus alcaniphilus]|uniref:hypothetical protein n=1 Tax=Pseudomaricurvus alcaniphilus TaxID=1166482 RepID=UPI001408EEAE|nr:hypothetical protein [Pseudomaricurvus alcaniphilus]NHN37205.1 hypothetical protein [Pseudomaricurvus alcaniphilus]
MSRDGSDWDYINEHMGGHDEVGLPNFMSESGFSEDYLEAGDKSQVFETWEEAIAWCRRNPGEIITRAPDGQKFVVKKKHIQKKYWQGNKRTASKNIANARDFFERIRYRRVGHLNIESLRRELNQLSISELQSLIPLLGVEVKSCYDAIDRCRFYKKGGRNESLQARDMETMLAEVKQLVAHWTPEN